MLRLWLRRAVDGSCSGVEDGSRFVADGAAGMCEGEARGWGAFVGDESEAVNGVAQLCWKLEER